MMRAIFYLCSVLCVLFFTANCQEYDFAAEITRQCLVPDPVGLLDCVENKVTLPYLTSWVDCTNSLGQNVRTSADIINYRCKSVWEGKGVIPEVFYIKDCVIEKTGLPAKNVSAEVLGAYKECESTPNVPQQRIKTAPIQQQQLRVSSVEYKPPSQSPQQGVQQILQVPVQQVRAPVFQQPQPQLQVQRPVQQMQAPIFQPRPQFQVQRPMQQAQIPSVNPQQPLQMQMPFQQAQVPFQAPASFQSQNVATGKQFGSIFQSYSAPGNQQQRAVQQQISVATPNLVQQAVRTFAPIQGTQTRPAPLNQQPIVTAFRPQYPSQASTPQYPNSVSQNAQHQPFSQQYFTIYPQAPLPNQQQNINRAPLSQKTVSNQQYVSQQLVSASTQNSPAVLNAPYSYSFQIHHPLQLTP